MTSASKVLKLWNMKSILRTIFVSICGGVAILTLFATVMPMLSRVSNRDDNLFTYYTYTIQSDVNTEKDVNIKTESSIHSQPSSVLSESPLNMSLSTTIQNRSTEPPVKLSEIHIDNITSSSEKTSANSFSSPIPVIHTETEKLKKQRNTYTIKS